jgi:hypothetical protein
MQCSMTSKMQTSSLVEWDIDEARVLRSILFLCRVSLCVARIFTVDDAETTAVSLFSVPSSVLLKKCGRGLIFCAPDK